MRLSPSIFHNFSDWDRRAGACRKQKWWLRLWPRYGRRPMARQTSAGHAARALLKIAPGSRQESGTQLRRQVSPTGPNRPAPRAPVRWPLSGLLIRRARPPIVTGELASRLLPKLPRTADLPPGPPMRAPILNDGQGLHISANASISQRPNKVNVGTDYCPSDV